MMHPPTRSLLVLAGVLAQAVSATPGFDTGRSASKVAARQGYFVAPTNASGSVPIKSFNLNKPYPGDWDSADDPSQQWHLTIIVTQEVYSGTQSFTGINVLLRPPEPGTPGALIEFSGPSNGYNNSNVSNVSNATASRPTWIGNTTANADWRVMVTHFAFDELRTVSDGNDMADGSCPTSVLSEECMRDMRAFVRANPDSAFNVGVPGTGYLPIMSNVDSCGGYTKGEYGQIPLNANYTKEAQWMYSYGGDGLEAYNKYGARTFPIMLVWGNAAVRDDRGFPTFDDDHVTFACVKVDTAVGEGSVLPTGEGQDGNSDGGDGEGGDQQPPSAAPALLSARGVLGWTGALVLGLAFLA